MAEPMRPMPIQPMRVREGEMGVGKGVAIESGSTVSVDELTLTLT